MSARPARHLQLVDGDTGEIVDSRELAAMQSALEKAKADLKNAERDLRGKRSVIARLEADKVRERLEHPQRDLIKRVAVYWHRKCRPEDYAKARPRINPLTPERFDAVAGIVEREEIFREPGKRKGTRVWKFQFEHFKAAIDGEAFDPFMPPMKNGKANPQNDLEQIFRTEARFEMAMKKCPYEIVPVLPARPAPGVDVTPRNAHTPEQVPSHGRAGQARPSGGFTYESCSLARGADCVSLRAQEGRQAVFRQFVRVGVAGESAT